MPSLIPQVVPLPDGIQMATYHRPGVGTPILCLPGLTRNHRDFLPLLECLPERPFYLVDLRGRGQSDWDSDPTRYQPLQYAADIQYWLDQIAEPVLDWVGTSLGGILTMALAEPLGNRMRRVVINDIGPVIELAGLNAIRARLGNQGPFDDWAQAERAVYAGQHSDHSREADWAERTRALCCQRDGKIHFDYDPAISQQASQGDPPDLWPLYRHLNSIETLIIRGQHSDLFSQDTLDQMLASHALAQAITVAGTGHAPTLKEPEAQTAVQTFLA